MKISNKKIYISVLLLLLAGAVIGGGVIYSRIKTSFQNQANEINSLKTQQQNLATQSQQQLKQAQTDLQNAKPTTIVNNISTPESSSDPYNISASDLAPFLTGVNLIICNNPTTGEVSGSGSLWYLNGKYTILTNHHVVEHPWTTGFCGVQEYDSKGNHLGYHDINTNTETVWNSLTDIDDLELSEVNSSYAESMAQSCVGSSLGHCANTSELNYSISNLPFCSNQMLLNSPVTIIGFPASTMDTQAEPGGVGINFNRTVTNGVISSYDHSVQPNLPDPNYYVSAKVDSGNSGGIALSKNNGKLCVLGVPTWVSTGNYENEGVIQNINNVMYTP